MTPRIYGLMEQGRSKRTGREAWHLHERFFKSLVDVEEFLHNFRGVGRFAIVEFSSDHIDEPIDDQTVDRVAEFNANHGQLEPSIPEILDELRH